MDGYRRTMLPGKNVEIHYFLEMRKLKQQKIMENAAQLSPAKSITRKSSRNTLY